MCLALASFVVCRSGMNVSVRSHQKPKSATRHWEKAYTHSTLNTMRVDSPVDRPTAVAFVLRLRIITTVQKQLGSVVPLYPGVRQLVSVLSKDCFAS